MSDLNELLDDLCESGYDEAADLIEQQQAHIAELKEQQHKTERLLRSSIDDEANKAVSVVGAVQNYISEVEKERDELAATVERLLVFDMTPGEYRRMINSERYKQNLNAIKREMYADGYYDGFTDCRGYDFDTLTECEDMALHNADEIAKKRYPDKE